MIKITFKELNEMIFAENLIGPEVDNSMEDCVCEDYWDEGHNKVVAYTKYYNNGDVVHYKTEVM